MPNVMNVSASHIRRTLQESYSAQEAANLSRIVCCEMLGQSTIDYYLGKDIILSPKERQDLDSILARLCNFEPIQYIQGIARFLERSFHVAPGVLIPRPETEELVEAMLREVPSDARILDIGTGSGCIAVSLSKALPDARVTAWDISSDALSIARRNNDELQASVGFVQRDVLTYVPDAGECYEAIVSNPPYVTESEKEVMERNVLDWEPFSALFVPDNDPLLFYRRIAELGRTMLVPGGRLYFEINRAYGEATVTMLCGQGYANPRILKDISGNDRIVIAER
jgi:protein-(glutamine-N5) methyltransferase, release factor-specific